MVNVGQFLKHHEEAGALSDLVGLETALDEHTFGTHSGDLVTFLSVRGIDSECKDADELEAITRRTESAVASIDDRFRTYWYMDKRESLSLPSEPSANPTVAKLTASRLSFLANPSNPLFSVRLVVALVFEGARPQDDRTGRLFRRAVKALRRGHKGLSMRKTEADMLSALDAARSLLEEKTKTLISQLQDLLDLRVLSCEEAFAFLRHVLNYSPSVSDHVAMRHSDGIGRQLCSSHVECYRDGLRVNDYGVKVLTLKDLPPHTYANLLRGVTTISGEFLIVQEWKRASPLKVRRLIDPKRRHFHNSKTSLTSQLGAGSTAAGSGGLVDNSAVARVTDLGACLEEIEIHGRQLGEFSLTIILYNRDPAALRNSVAQCLKVFGSIDAHLIEERYNQLNAWLGILPGNAAYNLRRIWLLNTNYADLAFLFAPHTGNPRNNHLKAEYLAVLEGAGGVPYLLNLHCQDVAHTFLLGATGSGKSFLLNFLLTNLQKYSPATFVFEIGGRYKRVTEWLGGRHLPIGNEKRPFTINPFSLDPTPNNLLFLFGWVRVLIESNGHKMSAVEEQDLYEQIENLYSVAPDQRRLFTLANIVTRSSRLQLQKWVQGGPYASLFDNVEDTLTLASFQTFDFEGMENVMEQLQPLLFYILHRASTTVNDPAQASRLKVFVMDEAWRFFRHPVTKNYIIQALKTGRVRNTAMILATQSGDDLLHSEMLSVVTESCPTRLFLANPGMDVDTYRRVFHLNQTEAKLIANMVPKRQFLLKQPDCAKLLTLSVTDQEHRMYSNSVSDETQVSSFSVPA